MFTKTIGKIKRSLPVPIIPSLFFIILFFVYPLLYGVYMSFSKATSLRFYGYYGLQNYVNLFNDLEFILALKNTVLWTVLSVAGAILLGFAIAITMNLELKELKFLNVLMFIPWTIPESISATIWGWCFHPRYGIINITLSNLGFQTIDFLMNENIAIYSCILVRIYIIIPFVTFNILAVLKTLPPDLLEMAEIDGASSFQRFRYITIPHIKSVVTTVLILMTIWTIGKFNLIFILTGGLANTNIYGVYIYRAFSEAHDLGLVSAAGIVGAIIMLIISYLFIYKGFMRR